MGNCFLHGNGGLNPLNYRVVAFDSRNDFVDNPLLYGKNTIGIHTTTPITSYIFDKTEPVNPVEGMVWFSTVDASGLEFNALDKDCIMVRPKNCMQHESGAWVEKDVRFFVDGEWVPWVKYLYDYGDYKTHPVTTYFASSAVPQTDGGAGQSLTVATQYADGSQKYTQEAEKGGILFIPDPLDITKYNTLVFDGSMTGTSSNGDRCALYVWSKKPSGYYKENVAASLLTTDKTITGERKLDISGLKGEHYIGFGLYGTGASFTIKTLRLEAATLTDGVSA